MMGERAAPSGTPDPDDPAARARRYREMGWWPGERLEARYRRFVTAHPDALAVADNRGHAWTHRELWDRSGRVADALEAHGVGNGDVVLLFLPNRAIWQVLFLALLRRRSVPASLPVTTDADTLGYMARLVGARLLVAAPRHGRLATGDTARAAAATCDHRLGVAVADEEGGLEWFPSRGPVPPPKTGVEGLDHVMFTSSTTGRPKAVMHTADTLAALNATFAERFSLGSDDPIFMASPLGHSVGGIHGARLALFTGAPLILQDAWDPPAALAMVAAHGCAFTVAATPFLKDLVDAPWTGPAPKLAPLRSFLCGGANVPPALMAQAAAAFPRTFVTVLWGMTEGGLTTCLPASPRAKVLETAGVGLPGLEIAIIDAAGTRLAPGQEGELAMRGPGVFRGYLAEDDLYRSCLTADGFFRTGDLATVDGDGYVRITGRLKDLLIRGGVNIAPVPIEDALAAHPDVRSVAVVGLADARLGERICAVIVAGNERPSLEDLVSFVAARGLPRRQWPEAVRYVDEMPRTAAGKIRKERLRACVNPEPANGGAGGRGR